MIPWTGGRPTPRGCAPRTCGDDPGVLHATNAEILVLPAPAGMIPALGRDVDLITSLRGLEPFFMDELERDTVRIYER